MLTCKITSHRGAAKRFRFTGKGKVKRAKAFASHLLTSKTAKRMRRLTAGDYCSETDAKTIKKLLPYGSR